MSRETPLGYDRIDEEADLPLRKPLDQIRRERIEDLISSGVGIEALMNSAHVDIGELQAYLSDASVLHPGHPQPEPDNGDLYAA